MEQMQSERVKLLGVRGVRGVVVLVSFSLEIYEKNGVPAAIFTNKQPVEATNADVSFHYGREVAFGAWVPFASKDFPKLPDPSFDPEQPIWVNQCGGFRDVEE